MSVVTQESVNRLNRISVELGHYITDAKYALLAGNDATPHVERTWPLYHALGEALRATGVEPPQPPEGADARVP